MHIRGLVFVGTRTEARSDMAGFLGGVLGLPRLPEGSMDAEVFGLPDGSSFAVTSPDGPGDAERTVGFLVLDVEQALDELRSAGITTDAVVASSATQRYVHFGAPDGHLYELVEEIQAGVDAVAQ